MLWWKMVIYHNFTIYHQHSTIINLVNFDMNHCHICMHDIYISCFWKVTDVTPCQKNRENIAMLKFTSIFLHCRSISKPATNTVTDFKPGVAAKGGEKGGKSCWPSPLITQPTMAQLTTWQACLAKGISFLNSEPGATEWAGDEGEINK